MQELNHKEGRVLKNWCFWIVVLEKTLESPLDSKVKPVNPKGNQPWIFIARTDAEAPNTSATWCEEVTHWKRPWCWGRLRAEEGSRGWDSWMGSLTQWTWVWENSRRWSRTGKPDTLVYRVTKSCTWLSDWTTKSTINVIGTTSSRF